jgi:ADP-ribose pyrophosphatase YjhB (NUDIX family)
VLLVQRAKPPLGLWSLPGGHVEFGETAVAAAERELREEAGITADLTTFVGLYEIIREKPLFHYAIACYGGTWRSGKAHAASDALEARWLAPGELDWLDFAPNVREAIARAQALLGL